MSAQDPLIVAMTGASGVVYGIRLVKALTGTDIPVELVMSQWAKANVRIETDVSPEYVESLADTVYQSRDVTAAISSGSYRTRGMVVVPCSMKTLGEIATGAGATLVARAADVTIKEGRPLVLVARETPLNPIHLENMLTLSRIGVSIMPPLPAFYNRPETIDDLVDHTVGRVLDVLGIPNDLARRWGSVDL